MYRHRNPTLDLNWNPILDRQWNSTLDLHWLQILRRIRSNANIGLMLETMIGRILVSDVETILKYNMLTILVNNLGPMKIGVSLAHCSNTRTQYWCNISNIGPMVYFCSIIDIYGVVWNILNLSEKIHNSVIIFLNEKSSYWTFFFKISVIFS